MISGQTFQLDEQALVEVAAFSKLSLPKVRESLSVGDTFSIAKKEDCAGAVINASRWDVDSNGVGKPRIGRPRRFPRGTVERLLGEPVTTPVFTQVLSEEAEAEAESQAEETLLQAEAEALLANESGEDDSW